MNNTPIYRRIRRRRDPATDQTAWREVATIYQDGRFEQVHTYEQGDEVHVFGIPFISSIEEMGWTSIREFLKYRAGFKPI